MKIGLLFKTEVGLIDPEYTAGAERMFLQDIEIFREEGIEYKAFCAGKFLKRKGFRDKVEKLYYPRFLCKLIREIERILPFNIGFYFAHYSLAILDLPYCLFFVLKCRDCKVWYAHQVPILALVNPPKTVVGFQMFYHLPFFKIFKNRYLQAKFYFCSQYLRDRYFQAHKGLENGNCRVIYNAVELEKFYPKRTEKKNRKGLNFLYASSWRGIKGIFLLLEAIELLEKRGLTENKFFIVGSPDLWYLDTKWEYQEIRKEVKRAARGLKTVEFLGKIKHSDLGTVYRNIDCLIFPSIWEEPFGLAIIEALACATPVIAFKVGGIPEILKDNMARFVLKRKSPEALADKIEELSSTPEVLEEMKEDCLRTAGKFSREVRLERLIEFIGCRP